MTARPRGFIENWRPKPTTAALVAAVIDVLDAYVPTYGPMTVRQIFYRLVATLGYDKTERAYKSLCETVNRARRARLIPFEAIRDDGDTLLEAPGYRSADELITGVRQLVDEFTLRRDIGQPVRLLIMVEASGMAPQVARVASRFGAAVHSAGGFNGTTGKHGLAADIRNVGWYENRPTVVLHIGDYDPSGEHVFSSLQADVTRFVEQMAPGERLVSFERIAANPEQIRRLNLPTAPAKATDRRSFAGVDGDGSSTVQAEALDPAELARIVEAAIRRHWRDDVEAALLAREERDRATLTTWFGARAAP